VDEKLPTPAATAPRQADFDREWPPRPSAAPRRVLPPQPVQKRILAIFSANPGKAFQPKEIRDKLNDPNYDEKTVSESTVRKTIFRLKECRVLRRASCRAPRYVLNDAQLEKFVAKPIQNAAPGGRPPPCRGTTPSMSLHRMWTKTRTPISDGTWARIEPLLSEYHPDDRGQQSRLTTPTFTATISRSNRRITTIEVVDSSRWLSEVSRVLGPDVATSCQGLHLHAHEALPEARARIHAELEIDPPPPEDELPRQGWTVKHPNGCVEQVDYSQGMDHEHHGTVPQVAEAMAAEGDAVKLIAKEKSKVLDIYQRLDRLDHGIEDITLRVLPIMERQQAALDRLTTAAPPAPPSDTGGMFG
jgi:hypothetical protein